MSGGTLQAQVPARVLGRGVDVELDGYTDLVAIGSGGNAHVYRAVDATSQPVAIKILQGGGDEAVARRFAREVRLMDAVADIDGLVPILDSGLTDAGEPYLVMPLFTGGSLGQVLQQGPVPWRRAVSLLSDVGRALREAHDREILHLDVKPANILLDDAGTPWLSDFGIAEMVGSTGSMSGAMMTPAYTPPERLRDVKPSKATDVYGLGATLFALLSGAAPFSDPTRSTNPAAVMMSVLNDPVPLDQLPSDTPDSLVELVGQAMAKDPDDRLRSVAAFTERLSDILEVDGGDLAKEESVGDVTVVGPSELRELQPSTGGSAVVDPSSTVAAPSESSRVAGDSLPPDVGGRRRWGLIAALMVAAIAVVVGVLLVLDRPEDDGETTVATQDDDAVGEAVDDATSTPSSTSTTADTQATIDPRLDGIEVSLLDGERTGFDFMAPFLEEEVGVSMDVTFETDPYSIELLFEDLGQFDLVVRPDAVDMNRRCADGEFVALDDELVVRLRSTFHDGLLVEGGGNVCGAAVHADAEYLIWYNPTAMSAAGFEVPENWDELESISSELISQGVTPWCVGFSGAAAEGTPGVEWMNNVLVRTLPLDTYDQVFAGELAWSDPAVRASFEWLDAFLVDERLFGGRAEISDIVQGKEAVAPLFAEPPGCYFYAAPAFAPVTFTSDDRSLVEGVDYEFMPFPALDRSLGNHQIVHAEYVASTSDAPDVIAVLDYLLSPAGQNLRTRYGLQPAANDIDPFAFIDERQRRLTEVVATADDVRSSGTRSLDSSILVPWWSLMKRLAEQELTVDEVLAALDESVAQLAE